MDTFPKKLFRPHQSQIRVDRRRETRSMTFASHIRHTLTLTTNKMVVIIVHSGLVERRTSFGFNLS
jgi:hypothetical protein